MGNPEYWKNLLGDDYSDDLMNVLQPSEQGKQADAIKAKQPAADEPDDGDRFYSYNAQQDKKTAARKQAPASPAASSGKPNENEEFSVNFDFDGEYRDIPDKRPIRPRREKKSGCLSGVTYVAFVLCVSLLFASLGWLAATDVLGLANEDKLVQVTIPEDFTIGTVADVLYRSGLIKYKLLFEAYAGFSHAVKKIDPGTYELNKNYDYRALVSGMSTHGGKRAEVTLTIPEGFTEKQIFQLLATNNVCTEDELWNTATNEAFEYDFLDNSTLGDKHRLEGFLFPDTYTFYVGDSATRVMSKMLDNFEEKFGADYIKKAKDMGYTVQQIVTIASMIEKEAGGDSERATIASVIYNRLNSSAFPYLQIDATIIYGIDETGEKFSTTANTPYNTYTNKGLPPGPIANPGIASIKAALNPQKTSYYFYALNKSRMHDFFKDAASFDSFVNSDQYGG
ncbi:endolytic transglycosylase MltG [Oscillospiraceae bacterium CM]|nr:endolytic transglycosylase MltG [Oscillospiraceae bacterium CM]